MSIFAFWPPELISAMMYSGLGSGPMLAAASAWDGLATDLQSTATAYRSVLSDLTSAWQGRSAAAMTSAAEPYLAWLYGMAAQAEHAGAQAKAAAAAFQTAFTATVPPPVIAANRVQLLVLVATNFFGQNAAAIAANEAQYAAMWAQDVAMMNSYALASMQATTLPSLSTAPQVAGTQATAQTVGSNALAASPQLVPSALSQMVTPTAADSGTSSSSSWLTTLLNSLAGSGSGGSTSTALTSGLTQAVYLASIPARFALYPMSMLMQLARMGQMGALGGVANPLLTGNSLMTSIGQFVDGKLQTVVGTLASHFNAATQEVAAKLGQAASLGALKVPEAWSAVPPAVTRAAPVLPNAAVSAPSLAAAGFPGGSFGQGLMGALSGRGLGGLSGMGAKAPKAVPREKAGG